MNIAVVGAGYVGLITAAGLAEIGHRIICVDDDQGKIEMLNCGRHALLRSRAWRSWWSETGRRSGWSSLLKLNTPWPTAR